jgi:hypothetical protein
VKRRELLLSPAAAGLVAAVPSSLLARAGSGGTEPAAGLVGAGWARCPAPVLLAVRLVRCGCGPSSEAVRRPQALGFQEVGHGLLTVALLATGYRLGS